MYATLTRAVTFHALHRYHRPEWSAEENRRRFGWTADAPGHGHLYRLEVTVAGPLDPVTSMIVDLGVLDDLIGRRIVGQLAGRHLNDAVPAFRDGAELPSCEALARWCWLQLHEALPAPARLDRIRVAEDESLWAECAAGPAP